MQTYQSLKPETLGATGRSFQSKALLFPRIQYDFRYNNGILFSYTTRNYVISDKRKALIVRWFREKSVKVR